jgi:hypothetical protein
VRGSRIWRRWLPVVVLTFVPALARAGSPPAVDVQVVENSAERIKVSYTFGDCELRKAAINGQEWSVPRLGREAMMLEKGAPDLPKVCRSVIIPDDAEMSVSVLAADYYEVSCDVAPSKGSIKRNVDPASVPYEFGPAYGRNQFFPGELVKLGDPYLLREQRGVCIELYPFQYNPRAGILRVYTDVTVELTPAGPGKINIKHVGGHPRAATRAFDTIYSAHFLNFEPALRYGPLDEDGDLLIICYDAWIPNVQPLVDHKNSVGINTTIVGVSTIGAASDAIKDYIQNVYDTSHLAFVLLVGDAAQVPTPTASGGASDATYAKLAGDDNYPDIVVGRFSAENPAQVDTQVLRTIEYETSPATEQPWFKRGVGIASALGDGDGDEGQSDFVHMGEIRDWLLAYDYSLVDEIYDPGAAASTVTNALNAGRGVVNYCGHGSRSAWTTTGFSSTQVAALTNYNQLPFIFSVACVNGQFAGATCFAEAWLRATRDGEPTGAVAAYMSSTNQDWAPPMEAQDEFNLLLTGEGYFSIGALCYAGSCSMMDEYGSTTGTTGVITFDTWILFGDPSLRVFGTAGPQHLPGDLNCDGAVNAFDIDPFVLALTDPAGYAAAHADCNIELADTNGDGVVNAFDIDPFVRLLTGG